MNKTELREHLKNLRQNLSSTERQILSQKICHQLEALDWSEVHSLHCFEPITKLGEVNATAFISTLQIKHPKIQLYTSRRINTVWEIVSWQAHSPVKPPQFDAIIVPMFGFDTSMHRIGYGGGYYDKFLTAQPQAKKIGVCFEMGKLQRIPFEPHDIPLDIIITESQTYRK